MDVAGQVTKAPGAFWDVIKRYWLFFLAALAAIFLVAMAKKDVIVGWFTTAGSAQKGDKLPETLRRWLGIAALAIVSASAVLYSPEALAATSSTGAALLSGMGEHWQAIAAVLGTAAVGIVGFAAPDVLDAEETHGGKSLSVPNGLEATTEKALYLKTATHATTRNGAPLVATDLTLEIACTITQNGGEGEQDLDDQDMALLLAYLEIKSPYMGNLTDQKSCTGPILDLVTRFVDNAFERSGDAPIVTIEAIGEGSEETEVTKYFTRPFAKRFLRKPLSTAPWLGLLHNTRLGIGVAADVALPSANSNIGDRVLKASLSYVPVPEWYYPFVAHDRVDNPASGSNGLTFKNFGSPGPECTEKVDYVHTIGHLSSHKGLGGNITFDTLTKLLAPRFGLDNVENIAHLVKARREAQYVGKIGNLDFDECGNYVWGTANAPNMALDALLFLLLVQPSLDMDIGAMRRLVATDELPVQYECSEDRVGEDKFYFGAIRRVSQNKAVEWRALPGSGLPPIVGQVRRMAGL